MLTFLEDDLEVTDRFDVAVVGATGAVGEAMLEILVQRKFPLGKVYALAASSLSNTGSPSPAGILVASTLILAPIESPSSRNASMKDSSSATRLGSAQKNGLSSTTARLTISSSIGPSCDR